jgi:hypothetical protein
MKIAKALAMSAVTGMLIGSTVACGGGNSTQPGATDPSAAGGKSSCSGAGGAAAPAPANSGGTTGGGKSSCSAAGGAPAPKY